MFSNFSISHATPGVRKDCRQQLVAVLGISFLPLIIGFLAIASSEEAIWPGSWNAFFSVFLHGELYFYAMSMCGHIFFLAIYSDQKGIKEMRLWSGLFVLLCVALMSFYVGQGEVRGTILHAALSVAFLIAAVFLNYRVLVLSQQPPPTPEDVHRDSVQTIKQNLDENYE